MPGCSSGQSVDGRDVVVVVVVAQGRLAYSVILCWVLGVGWSNGRGGLVAGEGKDIAFPARPASTTTPNAPSPNQAKALAVEIRSDTAESEGARKK